MSDASKRPRFTLRFLLLVVALVSVCLAWWRVEWQARDAELQWQRTDLPYRLVIEERNRAGVLKKMGRTMDAANQAKTGIRAIPLPVEETPSLEDQTADLNAIANELGRISTRVSTMRGALKELGASEDAYQRFKKLFPEWDVASETAWTPEQQKLRDEIVDELGRPE